MFHVEGTNILIPEEAVYKYWKVRQKMKPNVALIGGPFPGSTAGLTVFHETQHIEGRVWVRTHLYDKATGRYLGAQVWDTWIWPHRHAEPTFTKKIVVYPTPKATVAERVLSKDPI